MSKYVCVPKEHDAKIHIIIISAKQIQEKMTIIATGILFTSHNYCQIIQFVGKDTFFA